MAPRYLISRDLVASDNLQSTSPHWVLGFSRYANPITYDPASHSSITDDVAFAYQERLPILVIDDLGDCNMMSVSTDKKSHTASMQTSLLDSGTKYLNEILPGDWVIAFIVYSLDEAKKLAKALRTPSQVNGWDSGFKFLGRVQNVQKSISITPTGVPTSVYSLSCVFGQEFDSTVMYYPQLQYSDAIPVSLQKFGIEVNDIILGHEANERGAIDINKIIPKLMQVIFGKGAWASQTFREGNLNQKFISDHQYLANSGARNEPLTPNLAYIVPSTVCTWLGINKSRATFSDIIRILMGVQKFGTAASATNATVQPGNLFWPDGAAINGNAFHCPLPLVGAFPQDVVPQTTTTPWAFVSNYSNPPLNELMVSLRPDQSGYIYPFFTVRQTPYTSEVGKDFNLAAYEADRESTLTSNTSITKVQVSRKSKSKAIGVTNLSGATSSVPKPVRPPIFTRLPTTRFLELPRWVVSTSLVKTATLGRSDMMRQNLVFVFGSGPGVAFNEYDQFINAGPVKDDLDIYRFGVRPYMPSVNSFIRDLALVVTDWRDLMSDIVMGQHLTLNGSMTISGVRAPISAGDNLEFENIVYHIESVTHSCSIAGDGTRDFTTRLALSRGVVDQAQTRQEQFPNVHSTDPEGPPQGVTKD